MKKIVATSLFFLCLFLLTASILKASDSPLFDSEAFVKDVSLSSQSTDTQQSKESESNTRLGNWDTAREAKKSDLHPHKPSRFEKYWLNSEKGGLGWNIHGIYPKFSGFDSGAGLTAGIRYWRRDILGTPLEFQGQALYSIRKYKLFSLQFGKIMRTDINRLIGLRGYGGLYNFRGLDKKDYNFFYYGTLRYRDLTQEEFFGFGSDSLEDNRSDFEQKDRTFFGIAAYRLTSWSVVGGGGGYLTVEIEPGDDSLFPDTQTLFDDTTAPGLFSGKSHFVYGGGSFVVDLRDRPYNPHSGFMFGFEHLRYHDTKDTNFSFSRTSYDLRGYVPVFAENRTLAMQLYTSMNKPQDGNRVPFYMMETIGGADSLRGFHTYRFRDENLISLSAEYRWEPAPFWELALFYDAGKVFPQGQNWNFNDLQKGYGFGVRFKLEKSVLLRMDIGHSDEGTTFNIRISSPSF